MNKVTNTSAFTVTSLLIFSSLQRSLTNVTLDRNLLDFDVFCRFSNTFYDKLPIIYANIRV